MKGNPGRLIQLKDGRVVIMYNAQPLWKTHNKIVLHLVDEEFKWIKDEKGHPKRLIFDQDKYKEQVQGEKGIGMVD